MKKMFFLLLFFMTLIKVCPTSVTVYIDNTHVRFYRMNIPSIDSHTFHGIKKYIIQEMLRRHINHKIMIENDSAYVDDLQLVKKYYELTPLDQWDLPFKINKNIKIHSGLKELSYADKNQYHENLDVFGITEKVLDYFIDKLSDDQWPTGSSDLSSSLSWDDLYDFSSDSGLLGGLFDRTYENKSN